MANVTLNPEVHDFYKNEVPSWFAVQMGCTGEAVAAKVGIFP